MNFIKFLRREKIYRERCTTKLGKSFWQKANCTGRERAKRSETTKINYLTKPGRGSSEYPSFDELA